MHRSIPLHTKKFFHFGAKLIADARIMYQKNATEFLFWSHPLVFSKFGNYRYSKSRGWSSLEIGHSWKMLSIHKNPFISFYWKSTFQINRAKRFQPTIARMWLKKTLDFEVFIILENFETFEIFVVLNSKG